MEGIDVRSRSTTWLYHRYQHLVRLPSAPRQREQDKACLVRISALVKTNLSTWSRRQYPNSGSGTRSRSPTRPRTPHDSTHHESDVVILLATASTPSDTSSSRPGTRRRSAGPLVRSFEAWLWQLSYSRSTEVGDHAASTRSERSSAADSRLTDERTRDTSSEVALLVARRPSSGLQTVHHDALNPHRLVSDVLSWHGACRRRQPDEVCDPPTPLNT